MDEKHMYAIQYKEDDTFPFASIVWIRANCYGRAQKIFRNRFPNCILIGSWHVYDSYDMYQGELWYAHKFEREVARERGYRIGKAGDENEL